MLFIYLFIYSSLFLLQLEDNTLKLILDILCKIYRGEVWMCKYYFDQIRV